MGLGLAPLSRRSRTIAALLLWTASTKAVPPCCERNTDLKKVRSPHKYLSIIVIVIMDINNWNILFIGLPHLLLIHWLLCQAGVEPCWCYSYKLPSSKGSFHARNNKHVTKDFRYFIRQQQPNLLINTLSANDALAPLPSRSRTSSVLSSWAAVIKGIHPSYGW